MKLSEFQGPEQHNGWKCYTSKRASANISAAGSNVTQYVADCARSVADEAGDFAIYQDTTDFGAGTPVSVTLIVFASHKDLYIVANEDILDVPRGPTLAI